MEGFLFEKKIQKRLDIKSQVDYSGTCANDGVTTKTFIKYVYRAPLNGHPSNCTLGTSTDLYQADGKANG